MSKIVVTRGDKSPIRADIDIRESRPHLDDFGVLRKFVSPVDNDLAHIAQGLFELEGIYRKGGGNLEGTITFLVDELDLWNRTEVETIISDVIGVTLHAQPKIKFLNTPNCSKNKINKPKFINSDVQSICLFSGGIDSLSGILNANVNLGPTRGIFVSHAKLRNTVNLLVNNYLSKSGIKVRTITLPRMRSGLQQLRGFLYLCFGAIAARMYRTNNIVISETGPIMYQPELTALDEVTVTTHPFLIRMTKLLFKEIYGLDFHFYEPFENLTKAEVISSCPDKAAIPKTHSCITTRFSDASYPHCGRCYGCLVRRISCITAGVRDSNYGQDVFMKDVGGKIMGGWRGRSIAESAMTDLRALLLFAREILEDELPDSSAFKIKQFKKHDLFYRFALDVFAALYLSYDKTKEGQNSYCRDFYKECLADGVIVRDRLNDRIEDVRAQKYEPDFTFKI